MNRDNERKEAFAFWKDARVDGQTGADKFAEIGVCGGFVVDERGARLCVEGARGTFLWADLGPEQERALYEVLRARFDAEHRRAVEQTALAKLSPLEQEVLRARWSKAAETTTKGPVNAKKRSEQ